MSESSHSVVLEKKNENFWEEPCGTISLRKNNFENREQFDSWYLNFYPYLGAYIPFKSLAGNQVLEIGLGMGTVSEKLAEKSGSYLGIDVADAPVSLVAQRLNEKKLSGDTVKGNVLTYPFPQNFYDNIISIGCLHHTGNFELALRQVIAALKPGGNAIIMVYNAFSYRQWLFSPLDTFKRWISSGKDYKPHNADAGERFKYDSNSQGESAPFTEFLSSKQIRALLSSYKIEPKIRSENIGSKFFFPIPRKIKLKLFGPWLGLDLYVQFQKPITSDS